jgi:hypothetical protein
MSGFILALHEVFLIWLKKIKMKSLLIYTWSIVLLLLMSYCVEKKAPQSNQGELSAAPLSKSELVARGVYLVTIIGCDHCHSPKMMTPAGPVADRDRWLMGYPAEDLLPEIDPSEIEPGKWVLFNGDLTATVGPWGVSFAGNLTPHQTGLGNWTFENFKRAMTEGQYKGLEVSRLLLPPMPWESYAVLSEEDLRSIFEYLKTIQPLDNLVPNHIPPGSN